MRWGRRSTVKVESDTGHTTAWDGVRGTTGPIAIIKAPRADSLVATDEDRQVA